MIDAADTVEADTQWETWTCALGFQVMGIWPDFSDRTDINCVDRSGCGRYLATADDFGKVRGILNPP